jgi:DHA2 family multidrug resistance protein
VDAATAAVLKPMIQHLAMTRAINEAWAMIAVLTLAVLLALPFARSGRIGHGPPLPQEPQP